jgi:hypothetical protein
MRHIATIEGDQIYYPQDALPVEPSRAVVRQAPPAIERRRSDRLVELTGDPIDEAAQLLARVAKIAQGLNATDQRRIRELVHATSSMLSATTVLPRDDQRRFERALREA